MKGCALLSGGKDSNYALYLAIKDGIDASCAVTARPRSKESWLFHAVALEVVPLQAGSMGLRHHYVDVSGEKEREAEEMLTGLKRIKEVERFDVLIIGALSSRYQYERFSRIARALGSDLYAPLWQRDQEEHMKELVRSGFRFIISSISTMGLPCHLLGTPIGRREVEEIIKLSRRHGFNPAFEGGEAETLVIDAPLYRRTICIRGRRLLVRDFECHLEIESVWLGEKGEECLYVTG